MSKKSKQILFIIILATTLLIISCQPTINHTLITPNISIHTLGITNSTTPSATPTADFQALAILRATLWATEHPLPTPPIGYPSPQPPSPDLALPSKQYSYNDETRFIGDYVIRRWTNYFNPLSAQAITISTIGRPQVEVKHAYIDISELSGIDITGDGKPEIVLYGNDGGNQCGGWVYIFSLGDKLREIGNGIIRCSDYFKDLNNDGIYEYITTSELPLSLSPLYRIFQVKTIWEYTSDNGYINASSKFQSMYNDEILSAQSSIDAMINKGENPADYVYYLAMNYFYSEQDDKAWAVLEKYLNPEKAKWAGQMIIESRNYHQVQHP